MPLLSVSCTPASISTSLSSPLSKKGKLGGEKPSHFWCEAVATVFKLLLPGASLMLSVFLFIWCLLVWDTLSQWVCVCVRSVCVCVTCVCVGGMCVCVCVCVCVRGVCVCVCVCVCV